MTTPETNEPFAVLVWLIATLLPWVWVVKPWRKLPPKES